MSIGQFTILIQYSKLIISSIRYFFGLGQVYQDSKVSYDRVMALFNTQTTSYGNVGFNEISSIVVSDIVFNYENERVLKNISYSFEKGKTYLIHGDNGVGKSTFINCVIGIYNILSGNILYNNVHIQQCDMYSIRKKNIAVMDQNPIFPSCTLIEYLNLTNNAEYEEKEVIKKLKKAGFIFLCEDIIELFDKEDVGAGLSALSSGQIQKIDIARMVLRDTDMMIFDEPTSHLDQCARSEFYKCLDTLKKSKIIIVITHNQDEAKYFDEKMELNIV